MDIIGAGVFVVFLTAMHLRGKRSDVPTDPLSRAKYFASAGLAFLKLELTGTSIDELGDNKVEYHTARSTERRALWCEADALMHQVGSEPASAITELGPGGSLHFELASPTQLRIDICTGAENEIAHKISVYLGVNPRNLVAQDA